MPHSFFNAIVSLLLISVTVRAQSAPDTLTYFPNDRIEGGASAFYKVIGESIRYPASARRRQTVGTAIVKIVVSPEGNYQQIEMINSLSEDIDAQIQRAIDKIQPLWLADPSVQNNIAIFIPITFILGSSPFFQHTNRPEFLTEEVKVVGYSSPPSPAIKPDERIIEKAYDFYQKEKYQKSLPYLDELIRRNPYNKHWYIMRGSAHYQLDNSALACIDFAKVRSFLKQELPPAATAICP